MPITFADQPGIKEDGIHIHIGQGAAVFICLLPVIFEPDGFPLEFGFFEGGGFLAEVFNGFGGMDSFRRIYSDQEVLLAGVSLEGVAVDDPGDFDEIASEEKPREKKNYK